MGPENGINLEKVKYFSLKEYVSRIKLEKDLLEHLEETNNAFDEYMKKILKFDDYSLLYYWIDSLSKEMCYSEEMENAHYISPKSLEKNNVFFDNLNMSHARIKSLHQFVSQEEQESDYRKSEVRVSYIDKYTKKKK